MVSYSNYRHSCQHRSAVYFICEVINEGLDFIDYSLFLSVLANITRVFVINMLLQSISLLDYSICCPDALIAVT